MTTKVKIIIGFLLMVALMAGVAVFGYQRLQGSVDAFVEYERLSRLNVGTSDLTTTITSAATNINRFLDSRDSQFVDMAHKDLDNAGKLIADFTADVRKADRMAVVKKIVDDLKAYRAAADLAQKSMMDAYAQYSDGVRANLQDMGKNLRNICTQAKEAGNIEALYTLSNAMDSLGMLRTSMARYSESRNLEDTKTIQNNFTRLDGELKDVESLLRSEAGKQIFVAVKRQYGLLFESFGRMTAMYQESEKNLSRMRELRGSVTKIIETLSNDVDKEMAATGKVMRAANANAQQMMLIASIMGVVFGLLAAVFIIRGLVLVLKDMSGFAAAVANGDFHYNLKVKEKGEIGAMAEAMREIPEVLGDIMERTKTLANNISMGRYRDNIDKTAFSGAFVELAESVNFVGNTFSKLLDTMPVPLMACEKDNAILFLNQAAQTVFGSNPIGAKCRDRLKTPVCDNEGCFGACAMSRNAPYSGETVIHPQGKSMDVAVAAVPLHDLAGTVTGYIELLTDITEIKSRQAVMERVTKSASEIADRVAAAAEELSVRVEEISHGAEQQRDRVNSTATAMEEMNATVLEVARSAGQASEQSDSSRQKAEDGATLVNKVVGAINSVNTVAVTLQDNMHELGKLAEGIGGVMNVISDIADQTNLLALNAAIEAARAGEAGRGFAVVADEVRKLAEKTMSATQEVGTSITAIQSSARANINEVGKAVKNIGEATGLANSSGDALKEIVDLAGTSSAVVTSIATAAEEQSATSEEINRAIEEINRVVGATTDGIVQSSAAVQDLSRMAQELRNVMASATA
ncbi:MAG: methyl-accepting chemotaxis protein [Deltaproteobacteria bacterium]|jgi:methyl-accepting chemotaxis protein|nr:methyl-accepting chemotaxis protein [Deltaproteobacteria bacterium]